MNNLTLDDFDFDDYIYDQFDNEGDVKLRSANVVSYNCSCYGYGVNPPPLSEIPIPAAFYEFMRRKVLVEHSKAGATTRGKGRGRGRGRDTSLRRPGDTNTARLVHHSPDATSIQVEHIDLPSAKINTLNSVISHVAVNKTEESLHNSPDDTGVHVENIDRPSAKINALNSVICLPAASKTEESLHNLPDDTSVHVANTLPSSDINYSNDSVKSKVLSWLSQTSPSQNDSRLECFDANPSFKPDTYDPTFVRVEGNVDPDFVETDLCRKPDSWCSTPEKFPSDVEDSFEIIQPVKKVDKESRRKFCDSFLNDDNGNSAGAEVKGKWEKSPVSLMDIAYPKDRQMGQNMRNKSDFSCGENVDWKYNTKHSNYSVNKSPQAPRFRQESRSAKSSKSPRPPRFAQNRNEEMHRRLNLDTTNRVINRSNFSPPKDWNLQSCNMRAALASGFALNDDEDHTLRVRQLMSQENGEVGGLKGQHPAVSGAEGKKTSYEEHFPTLGGDGSKNNNKNDIKKSSSQASLTLKRIASNLGSV